MSYSHSYRRQTIGTRPLVIAASLLLICIGLMASPPASAQTFEEICSLPTTVNCWGFESEDDLYYTWPVGGSCDNDTFLQTHPNGRNGFGLDRSTLGNVAAKIDNLAGRCIYPQRDSTYSTSGLSSFKFTIPSQSGQQTSGFFNPVFKRLGPPGDYTFAKFGPGGEFWVRFSMRNSAELLNTTYQGIGGSSTGTKRLIIHGLESSESLEETIVDQFQRRVPQMYSDSGTEDYGIQPYIGCTSAQAPDYPEPPCRRFIAEQWRTYQVHVIVADNPARNNGLVELYLDDEPDPIIRVTNSDHNGVQITEPYTETAKWDYLSNGYGKLLFSLFATGKDSGQVHPEAYMWIDDVVVSFTRVPEIGGTTVRPNPPANVTVQ